LDQATLRSILTEPKNALIKQYKKLFELENIKLTIDDDVYDFMVEKAIEYKLGARGLRSICENILNDAMFEMPSTKQHVFHLDLPYAQNKFNKSKLSLLKVA
ncbi:MAG TPA: ATP-dependent Clp protease ATP-binding subunit ClpX, partial [Flavitalea sp.]|nr:ATP-dependent Clp protease ATP-binding subunit ClpX [Flavitalea sp.]